MKKIFAIIALIATMILSASCVNRRPAAVEVEADVEVVDSLSVSVDSLAVEEVVENEVAE